MTPNSHALADLGWSADFLRQLDTDELDSLKPARVTGVHRDRLSALSESGPLLLTLPPGLSAGDVAVGDWVLADPSTDRAERLLGRKTRIFRRATGDASREQLIVANVDTVFLTTSCTEEFNEARLERYLALAHAGGIPPVFVVTKADKTDDPDAYLDRLRAIAPSVPAILLNAKSPGAVDTLRDWCGPGKTVAFLGMSGVGKSTLASALTGIDLETGEVREDDMKGRHTTTAREMHAIPGGGWLIDTPGMRELRLTDMAEGIDETFGEITEIASECRFRDCTHGPEPGCAVQAAIAAGRVDAGRLERWKKLKAEDAAHAASAAEKRRRGKAFSKVVKQAMKAKRPG
ncbi:ribosome small subunit-dependent GTPase A [Defluviimonas sp. WL0050]|uniref:Small ribosomal subunit biogenesis GTPase RsgA n=1 Tax=Albidovulum litorale TaxID=2984134 RepID=A0ABT2ZKH5_9RHOB|nr:ribosome small subunit-dependent GTPase A [Defluviimonas sp. WL0050]MCV2871634.1 ribosome small subunit-dependent GTPase A [Defluviimonas sp. WL0050]